MLANLLCWVIALGLILSKSINTSVLFIKLGFAMGFILLGTLSKAVDVYHATHKRENKQVEKENPLSIHSNEL